VQSLLNSGQTTLKIDNPLPDRPLLSGYRPFSGTTVRTLRMRLIKLIPTSLATEHKQTSRVLLSPTNLNHLGNLPQMHLKLMQMLQVRDFDNRIEMGKVIICGFGLELDDIGIIR